MEHPLYAHMCTTEGTYETEEISEPLPLSDFFTLNSFSFSLLLLYGYAPSPPLFFLLLFCSSFLERQAEDQLAMLQGRARMATTLEHAKEEFHKRNGGTIVQSDWSYSGLAGKTMSPVWNSKVICLGVCVCG